MNNIQTDQSKNVKTQIINMTANVMKKELDKCYEAGMDDFIGKLLEVETLISKIRNARS